MLLIHLGWTHMYIHTTSQTKAISKNQVYAWWFNNNKGNRNNIFTHVQQEVVIFENNGMCKQNKKCMLKLTKQKTSC